MIRLILTAILCVAASPIIGQTPSPADEKTEEVKRMFSQMVGEWDLDTSVSDFSLFPNRWKKEHVSISLLEGGLGIERNFERITIFSNGIERGYSGTHEIAWNTQYEEMVRYLYDPSTGVWSVRGSFLGKNTYRLSRESDRLSMEETVTIDEDLLIVEVILAPSSQPQTDFFKAVYRRKN